MEDANKMTKLLNPSILKAVNNLIAFQNSPALKASIEASKNYEKIIQIASKYSLAGNAILENTFEGEMSKIIKDNFTGADFNFQMIVELLENEKAIVPVYLTSQELKDNYTKKDKSSEGLINERDIKTLIFESIEGRNPFLRLEQFYHNERQNPESLKLLSKYEEQYKNVSSDERSGIYFRIVK